MTVTTYLVSRYAESQSEFIKHWFAWMIYRFIPGDAITDSPLPLGLLYAQGRCAEPWFTRTVIEVFNSYESVNYLVERLWPYQPWGRYQTEDEARGIDDTLVSLLQTHNIPFQRYQEIT